MNTKSLSKLIDTLADSLGDLEKDDVLEKVGLETRKDVSDYLLPAIGLFGAGLAVGCGLGLLLAPKSGKELRADLNDALAKGLEQGRAQMGELTAKVTDKAADKANPQLS